MVLLMILLRMIDKVLFGILLLLTLQIPTFSGHYHQFLSGIYTKVNEDVQILIDRAKRYGFADARAMIDYYQTNPDPIIREEMQDNGKKLDEHADLLLAMDIFENGNLFNKVIYIAHPERQEMFLNTLDNFKPGIPLSINDIVFAFVLGIVLNLMITLPLFLLGRLFRKKEKPEENTATEDTPTEGKPSEDITTD